MMKNLSQSLQTYLHTNNQHFSSQLSVLSNVSKIDIVQLLASAASQSIQSNIHKQKQIQQGTAAGSNKINITEIIQQWNTKPKNEVNKFLNDNAQITLCSIIRPVQANQQTNQQSQHISNQPKQSIKKDDQPQKNKSKQHQRQRQNASDSYSSVKKYHNRQHNQSRNRKYSRQYEKQDNKSRDSSKIYYEKQRHRSRQKNNQRQRNISRDRQRKYYKQKQRDNWERQRQRQRQRQRERQREWERERQKQKQRQRQREREYKQKQRYYDYKTPTYRDTRYHTTNNTNNPYRFYGKNENPNNIYNQGGQHRKFIQNRQSLYHQYSNQYYDYYNRDKRYQ